MALTPGTRIGPYEVTAQLGEGGMGAVYRARDAKLQRDVALKVLLPDVANDPERLARFRREAQTLAALNHPHIGSIYGLEESAGTIALVLELVEGPTLADRLARGPIPINEALPIAKQIAEALDAAHEQGIVHRDLKPANIKVRADGTVKVLDFGLAKALDQRSGIRDQGSAHLVNSPTITSPAMTQAGLILGTAAYMAPEQAEGEPVDKRADIWSFGVVLWEMVTGTRLFDGKTVSRTLADVLRAPIDFDQLSAPAPIKNLLRRCLDRDVRNRLRDIGEARFAIQDYLANPESRPASAARSERLSHKSSTLPWIAAAAGLAAALAVGVTHFSEKPEPAPLVRSTLLPPPDVTVDEYSIAVSPDQTRVVFLGRDRDGTRRLWVRPLDGIRAQALAGTEGARDPFWSPDGQSIGFLTDGKLKRIDAAGGPVLSIADTGRSAIQSRGASWGSSGVILISGPTSLQRVSDTGGPVTDATTLAEGEGTHRRPFFLPDGQHFVFSAGLNNSPAPKAIRLGSLDRSDSTVLIKEADSGAVYAAGSLLFLRGGTLMAQPFDLQKLALTGTALPVVESVPGGGIATVAGFSAAQGLLVHASGQRSFSNLTWFDRTGNRIGVLGEPASFLFLEFSRDRRSVAVTIQDQEEGRLDMWLVDVARGLRTRVTSEGITRMPSLSPDGRMAFFRSTLNSRRGIYRKPVSGAASEELLYESTDDAVGFTVSPDGSVLLYNAADDLWVLPDPLGAPGKSQPRPLFKTPLSAGNVQFSPDGRWIAYQASETGRAEVYVMPYPGPGHRRQISIAGGASPRWRADGRELFFVAPDGRIAAAEVSVRNGSIESGEPQMLFNPQMSDAPGFAYDVSSDGQRILAVTRRNVSDSLTIVQNWPALLKK